MDTVLYHLIKNQVHKANLTYEGPKCKPKHCSIDYYIVYTYISMCFILNLISQNTLKSAPHLVITQYNFTAWPDHGVPKNSYTLISFIQRVQKLYNKKSSAPKLVHCSAGVGRTGTFILLDMMLEKMKEEDSIDVYAALCKLRRCRVKMVQTLVCIQILKDGFFSSVCLIF